MLACVGPSWGGFGGEDFAIYSVDDLPILSSSRGGIDLPTCPPKRSGSTIGECRCAIKAIGNNFGTSSTKVAHPLGPRTGRDCRSAVLRVPFHAKKGGWVGNICDPQSCATFGLKFFDVLWLCLTTTK